MGLCFYIICMFFKIFRGVLKFGYLFVQYVGALILGVFHIFCNSIFTKNLEFGIEENRNNLEELNNGKGRRMETGDDLEV